MNVANLRDYAKTIAKEQDISEQAYKGLTKECDAIRAKFMAALDAVAQLYPLQNEAYQNAVAKLNSVIATISTVETKVEVELARLNNLIIRGQARIADIQQSTKNLLGESYENLDATSKRLLADYAAEYKAATYTFWIKVVIIIGLMVVMKEHLNDILMLYVAIYITVYIGLRFYTAFTMRHTGVTLGNEEATTVGSA
jgi:hypothetical protein